MSQINITKEEALDYHAKFPAGKIGTCITKSLDGPFDLIKAYTPGVGVICEAIDANKNCVYEYTGKGNLVGVISNGTAVLGYGNIGPLAAKPVMEAKAMVLKRFADIDAFDIEIGVTGVQDVIQVIQALAPTFGALNLEDIKSPECFEIEEALIAKLDIPVVHDDQHATAIVVSAALLNALLLVNKALSQVQIVFSGAGAAAIATAKLLITLGAKPEHIIMCDGKGVIRKDRHNLDDRKVVFATDRSVYTLDDAVVDADVFIGLSVGNVLKGESVKKMAPHPIVFGLANPFPEISYKEVMAANKDVIFATGRGDYPNQVNNLLAFPYIFRGALDVRASKVNEMMQQAAVKAIAMLAQQEVPRYVGQYYEDNMSFGKGYILPKSIDPRLLPTVSMAVAKAAMDSGVARKPITNWDNYALTLSKRVVQA